MDLMSHGNDEVDGFKNQKVCELKWTQMGIYEFDGDPQGPLFWQVASAEPATSESLTFPGCCIKASG